ncbi:hypothetical protein [Nocardia abscessus]|uniref:hypothetical protein n=1 Tax=Nocardia abscessus TaxID=120957 RepID=UPI0024590667|nr:hypothetical protein [Nocardia abscessus]
MLAATFIPVGDAPIVLRSEGHRAAVNGIHAATIAFTLTTGSSCLRPEHRTVG